MRAHVEELGLGIRARRRLEGGRGPLQPISGPRPSASLRGARWRWDGTEDGRPSELTRRRWRRFGRRPALVWGGEARGPRRRARQPEPALPPTVRTPRPGRRGPRALREEVRRATRDPPEDVGDRPPQLTHWAMVPARRYARAAAAARSPARRARNEDEPLLTDELRAIADRYVVAAPRPQRRASTSSTEGLPRLPAPRAPGRDGLPGPLPWRVPGGPRAAHRVVRAIQIEIHSMEIGVRVAPVTSSYRPGRGRGGSPPQIGGTTASGSSTTRPLASRTRAPTRSFATSRAGIRMVNGLGSPATTPTCSVRPRIPQAAAAAFADPLVFVERHLGWSAGRRLLSRT